MRMYVDETGNNEIFLVAGLVTASPESVELAYKQFKKSISADYIPAKYKSKIYTEFKSTLLDRDYSHIKRKMLQTIASTDSLIVYSCTTGRTVVRNKTVFQSTYITLLSKIVNNFHDDIDIQFDAFGDMLFEETIVASMKNIPYVRSIEPTDSRVTWGIQFIDNICSVLRLKETNSDHHGYYEIIRSKVQRV